MKHIDIIEQRIQDFLKADEQTQKVLEKLHLQSQAIIKTLGLESYSAKGYGGWSNQLTREMNERDQQMKIKTDSQIEYKVFYRFWVQDDKIDQNKPFELAIISATYSTPAKSCISPDTSRALIHGYAFIPMSRALSNEALTYGLLHSDSFGAFCVCLKDKYYRAAIRALENDAIHCDDAPVDYWTVEQPVRGTI